EPVGTVQVEAQFSRRVHLFPCPRHDAARVVTHLKRIHKCFNRNWYRHLRALTSGLALDRGEVKRLIANERAAQRGAVLLPPEWRHIRGRRCNAVAQLKSRLIEGVVAQEVKRVPTNLVTTGLEDDIHRSGPAPAELGRITGRHDLKFLDGLQAQPGSSRR